MRQKLRLSMVLTACVALMALAQPALAIHSLPPTPEFWDCNNDHIADDTCVKPRRAGVPWSVEAATRFAAVDDIWRNNTDFDPVENTSSGQNVYRDRLASCISNWLQPDGLILGVVCRTHVWDPIGEWWRITNTPTYFNHRMPDYGLAWYYGPGLPPNQNQVHFGGVAVHEMGHWVRLIDLPCYPGETMCGGLAGPQDSLDLYSLSADDILAANAVY